jgi:Lon protease-like protein
MKPMGEAAKAALDNASATKRRRETVLVVNKIVLLSWQYLAARV